MLPWIHGKKKGYAEDVDGEVFKEWAINTGTVVVNKSCTVCVMNCQYIFNIDTIMKYNTVILAIITKWI